MTRLAHHGQASELGAKVARSGARSAMTPVAAARPAEAKVGGGVMMETWMVPIRRMASMMMRIPMMLIPMTRLIPIMLILVMLMPMMLILIMLIPIILIPMLRMIRLMKPYHLMAR